MKERLGLINGEHELSTRKQCELLSVNRSGLYYKPLGEKAENLKIMRAIDGHYLERPTAGILCVQDFLLGLGIVANHKWVRRLLRVMGIMAIYPKEIRANWGL